MALPAALFLFFGVLGSLLPVEGFNVELQHDCGSGAFARAGALTVKQGGQRGRGGRLILSRVPISREERAAFEQLVQRDGFYRVKVPGAAQKLNSSYDVIASVRARCLVQSGFQENLVLHVDSKERIFSVDYGTGVGFACRPGLSVDLSASWGFGPETDVTVRKAAVAPVIDVPKPRLRGDTSPAEKLYDLEDAEEEGLGDDGQRRAKKKEEPKSFLERNWMMLVFGGMLVMNVLGSLAPPPEGAAGAGGGARRAAR